MAAQKWRTEDWVAVYIGFFIIAIILAAFSWKVFDLGSLGSTFRWTTDSQIAARAPGWTAALEEIGKEAEARGKKDVAAAAGDLKAALQKNDRKAIEKSAGDLAKAGGRNTVRRLARQRDPRPRRGAARGKVFTGANLGKGAVPSASPGSSSAPSASR